MVDYFKEDGKIFVKGEVNSEEVLRNIDLSIARLEQSIEELKADKAKLISLK